MYPNFNAFARYRGKSEKRIVIGRQSQKYADGKRKASLP